MKKPIEMIAAPMTYIWNFSQSSKKLTRFIKFLPTFRASTRLKAFAFYFQFPPKQQQQKRFIKIEQNVMFWHAYIQRLCGYF